MRAVIDLDYVKYAAASVGEKRTVKVIHKKSEREIVCKNRTEFYGHWKKKDGGILAEINKKSKKQFTPDDFEYIDVQTPEPIENVLHTVKMMVDGALKSSGATDYVAYLGKGDSFRVERSTILKYKGNREGLIKPLYLDDVTNYLAKKYNAEIVTDIEADDACVIEAHNDKNSFVLGIDKDYYGCPVKFYNANKEKDGIVNCNGVGSLWLDDKGEVKGKGRSFMMYQVCAGDASDHYKANSASEVSWGDISAYNRLVECKTDKELWATSVDIYKHLYPEPKVIQGWRGDEFEVDWLYVFQENFDLARMLRFLGDKVVVTDVLKKLGVDYE